MLFRLSRLSFWLAAAIAALGLVAPVGHERLLLTLVGLASLLAFALWRSALRSTRRRLAAAEAVPAAQVLDAAALLDAAAQIVRGVHEAASFEAALHAAVRVLRSELGARQVAVHEVHAVDANHALLSDLVEAQPGFKSVPRQIDLGASPLGRAIRSGCEAGTAPGTVALPVTSHGTVVAALVLSGIDVPIESGALAALLALTRTTLASKIPAPHGPRSDVAAPSRPRPATVRFRHCRPARARAPRPRRWRRACWSSKTMGYARRRPRECRSAWDVA